MNKVETLEKALEVKGEECEKAQQLIEDQAKKIEEVVGQTIVRGEASQQAQSELHTSANGEAEQIAQLQREIQLLKRELAEEKIKGKMNEEAKDQLNKIRSRWSEMAGIVGVHNNTGSLAGSSVKQEPFLLDE